MTEIITTAYKILRICARVLLIFISIPLSLIIVLALLCVFDYMSLPLTLSKEEVAQILEINKANVIKKNYSKALSWNFADIVEYTLSDETVEQLAVFPPQVLPIVVKRDFHPSQAWINFSEWNPNERHTVWPKIKQDWLPTPIDTSRFEAIVELVKEYPGVAIPEFSPYAKLNREELLRKAYNSLQLPGSYYAFTYTNALELYILNIQEKTLYVLHTDLFML